MTTAPIGRRPIHAVQFYEREPFLHRAVAEQLSEALRRGEPIVMIARRRTFDGVSERLAHREGRNPRDVARQIRFVDVDSAVAQLMEGAAPNPVRFEQMLTSLLASVRKNGSTGTIWFYGEMVDVLCRAGNHAAAIQLEELWNDMSARETAVSVICGYSLEDFDGDENAAKLRTICRLHSHVGPAESITEAPDEHARFEQIALLQHRSRTLDRMLARDGPKTIAAHATAAASTVYIVDDDPSVRQALTRLLSTVELRVRSFASAEAFLADVERSATGCLILDVQLVGMTGPELQACMASDNWQMPVIAMTASDDTQIETKALRLGACAFLRKPFEASALFGAIARALSGSDRGLTPV